MAVYARCKKCKCRRDLSSEGGRECIDKIGHKRYIAWTANVQFERGGRRLTESFKTEELALKQERQWYADHDRGTLVVEKKSYNKLFSVVAVEWLNRHVAQSVIEGARRNDKYRVNSIVSYFGEKPMGTLAFKDGDNWITQRLVDKAAVGTIKRDLTVLKLIISYARKAGYLEKDPFIDLRVPGTANIHDRWMTQAEIETLIRACRGLGDQDLVDVIAIGLNTGFRKGNLERLTARDVTSNRLHARVTKNGAPYDVPITPAIVPTLQRLLAARPTGKLLNTVKLDGRFREAAKAAGLYTHKKDLQRVTIHTMRHTFAVLYLERGGDIYDLQELLGHKSVAETQRTYGRYTKKRKDAQAPLMSTPIVEEECPQTESNRSSQIENLMS